MNPIQYERLRRTTYGRASCLFLSVAITALGCGGPWSGSEPVEKTSSKAPESRRITLSTVVAGESVDLTMELSADGDRLAGIRTVRGADGTSREEPFTLSLKELQEAAQGDPSAGGMGLTLVSAQTVEKGTQYLYRTQSGEELSVLLEGDLEYLLPAVAVLAIIGVAAIIATCGFLTYYSIKSCAKKNRCWSFSNWALVCFGSCRAC